MYAIVAHQLFYKLPCQLFALSQYISYRYENMDIALHYGAMLREMYLAPKHCKVTTIGLKH
jgi:hypothetical protein